MIKQITNWIRYNILRRHIEQPIGDTQSAYPPNNYTVTWLEESKEEEDYIEASMVADSVIDACEKFGMANRRPGLDGPFIIIHIDSKTAFYILSLEKHKENNSEIELIKQKIIEGDKRRKEAWNPKG